ncbi:hypothetical protein LMG19282_03510 [Cupriavidus campinensis]|nr:hypothetical protein LMG19282_03510 [Cupriavidus campinensis]
MGSRISPNQTQRQSLWQSLSLARRLGHVLAGAVLSVAIATGAQVAVARQATQDLGASIDGMAGTIATQQLPNDARQTLERIESGGPFPFDKDGSRFGNYERILPQQPRGYYREYTVKNSNSKSRNRGARRIVCGGDQRAANDCYYTEDHYNSFKRITK